VTIAKMLSEHTAACTASAFGHNTWCDLHVCTVCAQPLLLLLLLQGKACQLAAAPRPQHEHHFQNL
jgi:hypothetical protein